MKGGYGNPPPDWRERFKKAQEQLEAVDRRAAAAHARFEAAMREVERRKPCGS